ncbi:hypothetical protein MMC13_006936 [Lambiella insularis]|nr:hypothetical protein [Lambiella insularis]
MSTNTQQQIQLYPQLYPTTDIVPPPASPSGGDNLESSAYVLPAKSQSHASLSLHSPNVQHQQRLLSEVPISQYPQFKLSYQNGSSGHVHNYEGGLDGRIDPLQDLKGTYDRHFRGAVSEMPEQRVSIASAGTHRGSVTSIGKGGYAHRHGSIDGSEVMSPISSQGLGTRTSDESIPEVSKINGTITEDSKNQDRKDRPPPWSELKTKAGKERKRLPLACIACRRKKIRCSGEKPACKHCLRSRIPCVYKVTTRKAAPRTDYMAMLDKRLKRMEERVIKIIPLQDTGKLSSIGRANVKPTSAQTPKSGGSKKRAAEEAFSDEIDDWAAQSGAAKTPAHSRQISGIDQSENRLLIDGAEHLPLQEIQEHLSEVFFDCLAGTVPPVLILAVCAIAARFSTHPQVNTEPAFLRGEPWAKPARDIALRRYDQPNITILTVLLILGLHEFGTCHGGRSWMLGGMAMRMAYALQLHKELDHDPIGRKHDKSSELSFTDREIRRRTMWACFLMDRFNSSGTERPPFANEENVQVRLPIRESYFQMEVPGPTENLDGNVPSPVPPNGDQLSDPKENMGVAAYLIRIIALWGRVIKYNNLGGSQNDPHPLWDERSQFAALKAQTNQFRKSLPESLHFSIDNLQAHAAEKLANQFLFLHVSYNQVVLFLHKFAIPASPEGRIPKDMPHDFVDDAAKTALEAASQISSLLNETSDYLVAAPFAGYCAFVSSTVHVWGIFSKNPQLEASSKRNLAHNVKYLGKMKKYWGMFHYMIENLKDIYRSHADAPLKGPNATESTEQDGRIFQYGDWFNKYPHGVSGTDYENPAIGIKSEFGNDAALSQKSNLQSVEEFFSTLSPQSRADHQRKSTKRSHARGSTHRDPHPRRLPIIKTEPHLHQQQIPSHQDPILNLPSHPHPHHQPPPPLDPSAFAPQLFPPTHSPFAPDSFMPLHHGVLLQDLDRQLVFDAYAGACPTPAAPLDTLAPASAQGIAGLWDSQMDFSQLGPGAGGAFGDVGSNAWCMPFNLQPPDVGADGEFVGMGYGVDGDGRGGRGLDGAEGQ